jgi:hypothetical protein
MNRFFTHPRPRAATSWAGLVLVGAAAGIALFAGRWGRQQEPTGLADVAEESDQLDRKRHQFMARAALKDRIIRRLVRGETTLLEAAGQFRYLDQAPPALVWDPGHDLHPRGLSPEETHCREVIAWAGSTMGQIDPCQQEWKVAQLEDEVRRLLRQGPLHLPDAPPAVVAEFEELLRQDPLPPGGRADCGTSDR